MPAMKLIKKPTIAVPLFMFVSQGSGVARNERGASVSSYESDCRLKIVPHALGAKPRAREAKRSE
jgi:hypothetical protein